MRQIPVEVCVEASSRATVRMAVEAARLGGAHRVELCSAMHEGGLTPAPDLIEEASRAMGDAMGLVAMIRPVPGGFCYPPEKLELMSEQIRAAREAGASGVALGILKTGSHAVDVEATGDLAALAREHGLAVTFHRAFDAVPDAAEAAEALIRLAVDRVLTSGTRWGEGGGAVDGLPHLRDTVSRLANRIEVVIGGGVGPDNVRRILRGIPASRGLVSIHAYSGVQQNGRTAAEAVRALVDAVNAIGNEDGV